MSRLAFHFVPTGVYNMSVCAKIVQLVARIVYVVVLYYLIYIVYFIYESNGAAWENGAE